MENTQKKVYAKYTFASISLALVLIAGLAGIFIGWPYSFFDLLRIYKNILIIYCTLSFVGIILVIRAYKYIYASKKQGIPVRGFSLIFIATIVFVLIFGLLFGSFSFSTYEAIRMEIDPCYKPASNVDCLPLPLR